MSLFFLLTTLILILSKVNTTDTLKSALKARVFSSTGSWYYARSNDEREWQCRLKGNLRLKEALFTNPVAVGDWVYIEPETNHAAAATISEVLDRNNYIIRQSPRNEHKSHILASNIDEALLITSLRSPRTSLGFIDRFLVTAEMFHIPVSIIVNKKDLYNKDELAVFEQWRAIYEPLGYRVFLFSAMDKADIDKVKRIITGKTSLFAGHSGVGKSTIINAIIPEAQQKTRAISDYTDKGMHTTTYTIMFRAPLQSSIFDSFIIDTPGVKEWQPTEVQQDEISHYFPEMRSLIGKCRFNNCLHINEPHCAVTAAVQDGTIAASRYHSYTGIVYPEDYT